MRLGWQKKDPIEHSDPVSVLLVDDDSFLRHALCASLEACGYVVEEAQNGEEAIQAISQKAIDLVLLDVNLPGIGGVETCRRIRDLHPDTGLLTLTVSDRQETIVETLEGGADDYVVKPIRFRELVARMRAVERRARLEEPFSTETLRIGELELDPKRQKLKKAGREIRLSQTEFNLLAYLMRHPGVPLTHTKILREVWGRQNGGELERLRTYCKMLRKKIENDPEHPEYLVTERSLGYRLQAPRT